MRYKNVITGTFISRPNRFIAHVMVDGEEVVCHVKNTGRCRELLVPGARVVLSVSDNPARKTKYDLVAVWKGERLINMDSQAPNVVFGEWARETGFPEGIAELKSEVKYGNSRFDFYYRMGEDRGERWSHLRNLNDGGRSEVLINENTEGERTWAAIPQASRPAPFAQGSLGIAVCGRQDECLTANGGEMCEACACFDKEEETAIPQASRLAPFAQGSRGDRRRMALPYGDMVVCASHNNSRNGAGFIEVKGVTLENDGVARFPDAPTARGAKHVRELIKCKEDGYGAYIAFVVQMAGMKYVTPNEDTDPYFAAALRDAAKAGVNIIALECAVTEDSMEIAGFLPVRLD